MSDPSSVNQELLEKMRQWVRQKHFSSLIITQPLSPSRSSCGSSTQTLARSSAQSPVRPSAQSPVRSSAQSPARSSAQTSAQSQENSSKSTNIKSEATTEGNKGDRRGYPHSSIKLETKVSAASADEDSDATVKLETSRKKNTTVTHKKEVKRILRSDQKKRRNPGKFMAKKTGTSVVKPRRKSSYSQYYTALHRTAKKYCRFNTVSCRSMVIMNDLMKDIFDRVALEARTLMTASGKKVMTARDIEFAVKMVFPGYLADRATLSGLKALHQYYGPYNK